MMRKFILIVMIMALTVMGASAEVADGPKTIAPKKAVTIILEQADDAEEPEPEVVQQPAEPAFQVYPTPVLISGQAVADGLTWESDERDVFEFCSGMEMVVTRDGNTAQVVVPGGKVLNCEMDSCYMLLNDGLLCYALYQQREADEAQFKAMETGFTLCFGDALASEPAAQPEKDEGGSWWRQAMDMADWLWEREVTEYRIWNIGDHTLMELYYYEANTFLASDILMLSFTAI